VSFSGGGAGRRGECGTKTRYHSRGAALQGLAWMVANLGSYEPAYKVKECTVKKCGGWHVSHRLPKDRKGKRFEK
jgi:hypothetical protein